MRSDEPGNAISDRGWMCFIKWGFLTQIFGNDEIGFYAFIFNNTRLTCTMIPL
jgi:hypothetical protein